MAKFIIQGGVKLMGSVVASGAKNAALKMIAASIASDGVSTLKNVPQISDVQVMIELVKGYGVKTDWLDAHTLKLDAKGAKRAIPDPTLVRKLRASFVLVGPALARFGEITIAAPGGDQIGKRPLDSHFEMFRQMGVNIKNQKNGYHFDWKRRTNGKIFLSQQSVTATENALMAATLGAQCTTIYGAASEPEIGNLIDFLRSLGADIEGKDTAAITIKGVKRLKNGQITIIPDRIETGTVIIAGLITQGVVAIEKTNPGHSNYLIPRLRAMGATITVKDTEITAAYPKGGLRAISIDTRNYPGFYTDLQSPMAALMTQAAGTSQIFETLYESRFNYVDQLNKMGGRVKALDRHRLEIVGPSQLGGAHLVAPQDIRAGGALVLAALAAKGESEVENIEVIDRGYERLDDKLRQLGAKIERIEE